MKRLPEGQYAGHIPVLLWEVLENLVQLQSGTYVDATFGRGGHAREILKALDVQGRLIGLDRDPEACAVGEQLAQTDARFSMHHFRFGQVGQLLGDLDIDKVDGILMDVGVSSPQLDQPHRGFSFLNDGPLDMRMDPSQGQSAADWLNQSSAEEISRVLKVHGEERSAWRIANAIVAAAPLETTTELARVVEQAVPAAVRRNSKKHPATKTFQAIRIFINAEHEELTAGVDAAFARLKPGGRLAVISFHSLEDRVVKHRMRELSQPPNLPRRLPISGEATLTKGRLIGRAIKATAREVVSNPRARSATLRVIERTAHG